MMRTGFSGLAGTVLDVVTMVALVESAQVTPGLAAFMGSALGAVVGFVLARFWAFGQRGRPSSREVGTYALVALGSALMVATAVHVLATVMGFPYLAAKALAASFIFLCWSYPAQSRLVFRQSARRPVVALSR